MGLLHTLTFAQEKKEKLTSYEGISARTIQKKKLQDQADNTQKATEEPHLNKKQSNSFYIKDIILKDAKFLNRRTRKRLLAPYLNKYLNAKKVGNLVQDIRAYYLKKGYPTTQVKVVLGQNLKDGVLQIVVSIGFIEEIILNDHKRRDSGKVFMAFPWFRNRPLYLPYLEQGIDQINSVPSSNATLKILPGLLEGGSVIQIDHIVNKPVRLDLGGDNLGEEDSGKWRWKYNLSFDNLFRINDNWVIHYNINQAKKLKETKLRDYSFMVKFSFPVGYFNFSTTHTMRSSIKPIRLSKQGGLFTRKNNSHNYDIKFLIYKHRNNKGSMILGFTHATTTNYVQDIALQVQNDLQTQLKVGTNHLGLIFAGQYMLDFNYEQNLTGLGSETGKESLSKQDKKRFKKFDFHFSWVRPFALFKQFLSYKMDCLGQYSKDEGMNLHQLTITNIDHVRGFEQSYTGHKGICSKQELSLHHLFSFSRWLRPLEFQAGIDIGYLPKVSNIEPKLEQLPLTLMGWGLGCRYHINWLSLDFTYAKPLYISKHLTIPSNTYQMIFNFTIKLHALVP
ncbi:MAG: hypothetical protein BGO68_01110 [Candidatus Amoebophilus sp. 36-38]|nr:MAG: hypothetical protein BGO68_01110 [Candidatus Amoebophilus sp. 36-38]